MTPLRSMTDVPPLGYNSIVEKGGILMLVTKEAPDFTAEAFYNGKVTKINLSDYRGKWVVVCFYPGDFTFV
jgi:hypothetical protein